MVLLFFICLCGILYTYFGYPLLLMLLTRGKSEAKTESSGELPTVSLIISAHNEEAVIAGKIENALGVDYPEELLEIIVVSDSSTDATPSIVRQYEDRGVRLIDISVHVGKTEGQNRAVRQSTGDILVFSDANSMFVSGAVKELVHMLDDEKVGCVCGELRYRNSTASAIGKGESLYWRYERFCKKRESLLGSLLGVNGAIYSVRRKCFVELDPHIISDFILPMVIYSQGYEILYSTDAAAFEDTSRSFGDDFRRKKRIIVRSLHQYYIGFHTPVNK
jgi:cellulose synthase/poly-beta-1,6-N-acetylglucosamine synthase-like glycosyltransferase